MPHVYCLCLKLGKTSLVLVLLWPFSQICGIEQLSRDDWKIGQKASDNSCSQFLIKKADSPSGPAAFLLQTFECTHCESIYILTVTFLNLMSISSNLTVIKGSGETFDCVDSIISPLQATVFFFMWLPCWEGLSLPESGGCFSTLDQVYHKLIILSSWVYKSKSNQGGFVPCGEEII